MSRPTGRAPRTVEIAARDGATIAVHHLAGEPGLPRLLVSHATGFHGRCYAPMAAALGDRYEVLALDHRGHGATAAPPGWQPDWRTYGEDTVDVARALAPGGGLTGFGHSMGGATLLLAALADPSTLGRLVLFEPIVIDEPPAGTPARPNPLAEGAARRRRRFGSYDEAYANYAAKPPLAAFAPAALRAYVDHGLRPVHDADGEGDGVELCCAPELESAVFRAATSSGLAGRLHEITTPTLVLSGRVEPDQPSSWCAAVAAALVHGRFRELPGQAHFGPFTHPAEVAAAVTAG